MKGDVWIGSMALFCSGLFFKQVMEGSPAGPAGSPASVRSSPAVTYQPSVIPLPPTTPPPITPTPSAPASDYGQPGFHIEIRRIGNIDVPFWVKN